MARDYSKISPFVWTSSKFKSLPNDEFRLAYLFLFTSKHQTNAGAYHLPFAYAAYDLGWSAEKFEQAIKTFIECRLVFYDFDTEEVYLTNWFQHNPPTNQKHLKGIEYTLARIDSDYIRTNADRELSLVYFDRDATRPNTPPTEKQDEGDGTGGSEDLSGSNTTSNITLRDNNKSMGYR